MKPDEFIAEIAGAAQISARDSHVPASFTVAEAALESGWGRSILARDGFNLFGVKADRAWSGPVISMRTREHVSGVWLVQEARFRKYANWLQSIHDHAAFLMSNPRYRRAFAYSDGESFARAVAAAGYATDPDYAGKLLAIMQLHHLSRLDTYDTPPGEDA